MLLSVNVHSDLGSGLVDLWKIKENRSQTGHPNFGDWNLTHMFFILKAAYKKNYNSCNNGMVKKPRTRETILQERKEK